MDGATILAHCLKSQGVEYVFGILGFPILQVGTIFQGVGLKFIATRNEQSASYAASAIGYLSKKPAVCLVVPGPGFVHALAGMSNAMENGWPLLVIAASSDIDQDCQGAFQSFPQVEIGCGRNFSKLSAKLHSVEQIPYFVEKMIRTSVSGRAGCCYLDIPGNLVDETSDIDILSLPLASSCHVTSISDPQSIEKAATLLRYAKKPLIIVGKGAAFSRAENEVRCLVVNTQIPFLPTPMGKGVMEDEHPLCVASARSMALKNADVIVLLGARLNWMLHFGKPPRFHADVKFIQVDCNAEELGNNVTPGSVCLLGDVGGCVGDLYTSLHGLYPRWTYPSTSQWWDVLNKSRKNNAESIEKLCSAQSHCLTYYSALHCIRKHLDKDCVIINEGANTMDIGRTMIPNTYPRHRLDAGSFGTMGVGLGFSLAAAVYVRDTAPHKRVVAVLGDSAFGFSGMEVETLCRYNLPVHIIILNNNGIGNGLAKADYSSITKDGDSTLKSPPTCLLPDARYEKILAAFTNSDKRAYFVEGLEELDAAMRDTMGCNEVTMVNVMIDPSADRKPQEFFWLTRSKM